VVVLGLILLIIGFVLGVRRSGRSVLSSWSLERSSSCSALSAVRSVAGATGTSDRH
jgi:hypothetical protein